MERTATETATAWMAAVVAGDADAAVALSSPSIVYTTGQVRRYEGHEGLHDIVADLHRLEGMLSVDFHDLIEDRGVVAMRRVEYYTLPVGGIEIRGCSFVEVEDGVVTRWMDYKSMETIDTVVG